MQIMGFQRKDIKSKIRCDFDNKAILPGKAYQIRKGNPASGFYHGPRCYQEALKNYDQLKKQVDLQQQAEDENLHD